MTDWHRKSFEEQLSLLKQAAEGDMGILEEAVIPTIRFIAFHYVDEDRMDEVIEVGLSALPFAVSNYLENLETRSDVDYKFSPYFASVVQMTIEAWLSEDE